MQHTEMNRRVIWHSYRVVDWLATESTMELYIRTGKGHGTLILVVSGLC